MTLEEGFFEYMGQLFAEAEKRGGDIWEKVREISDERKALWIDEKMRVLREREEAEDA